MGISATSSQLGADLIVTALDAGTNVTIIANNGGGNGDIMVTSNIAKTAGGNAVLQWMLIEIL